MLVLGCVFGGCGAGVRDAGTGSGSLPVAVSRGPQLGYVWRAADKTLRPILGIPGSSQVGESVVPAGSYVYAASSPVSAVAVLVAADGTVSSMALPAGAAVPSHVRAGSGSVVRFSPSGVSAVMYVPGATSATLLTAVAGTMQASAVSAPVAIAEMAVSDAGVVVGRLGSGGSGSLQVLTGVARPVVAMSPAGGVSFIGKSDDVVAADAVLNTLVVVRAVSTAPSVTTVGTGGLLKTPVAVGAAGIGNWVVVANGGESSVVRVDLSGAQGPQRILSATQPVMVEPLMGNGVFRFTEMTSAEPLWLADITAARFSLKFIPAVL